jgi:hypothetical protein
MDPRKTVVIADFDEIVRGATEPSRSPPSAAGVQPPVPQWGVQTLAWPSGGDRENTVERTSGIRERPKAAPTVIIGRTVIAAGQPRGLSLGKTQVWRRDVTISAEHTAGDATRPRARVEMDESVMQHLSAELWAGQASQNSHLMVTTVRQSIDVQATFIETRRSEPQPTIVANADVVTKTEVVAGPSEDDDVVQIPRRFRLPDARTIRIACAALCIASLGAVCLAPTGWHAGLKPRVSSSDPQPRPAAAVSGEMSAPVEVETTWRPARTAPPAAAAAAAADSRDALGARAQDASAAQVRVSARRESPAAPTAVAPTRNAAAITSAASGKSATSTSDSSASPRAAVDALIAGRQDLALARYRALAKSRPTEPAYEAAARILAETKQRESDGP